MAALLGLLTGILAFIPNIGAIISGVLMVLVGFSGGTEMGLWTIAIYLAIQNFDGYVLVPMIAARSSGEAARSAFAPAAGPRTPTASIAVTAVIFANRF